MKEGQGLVSVIIPTYNRALACRNAVQSALAQTHGNVEIIVVDDGSTDNTRDVVCGMDNRVKYVWQSNAGVSAARNCGLKEATGSYIAFLDSDDEWLPWKLEAQLSVLNAFPEAGMVWSDMRAINEAGATLHESYLKLMYSAYTYFDREAHFRTNLHLSDVWGGCPSIYSKRKCYVGNIFSWMFMGNLVHTSTVLLRRDRQVKVGFFDVDLIKSGEDYDYHFRTCREGDVAYLDASSILYRIGSVDQLTDKKHMIWVARNNLKTVNKMLFIARDGITLPPTLMRKRLAESFAWVGFEEFMQDSSQARKHFIQSLKLFPFQRRTALYFLLSCFSRGTTEKLRATKKAIRNFIRQ